MAMQRPATPAAAAGNGRNYRYQAASAGQPARLMQLSLESVSHIRNLPHPVLSFSGKRTACFLHIPAKVHYTQRAASRIILSLSGTCRASKTATPACVSLARSRAGIASRPETGLLHLPQGRICSSCARCFKASAACRTRRLHCLARHFLHQGSSMAYRLAAAP